ncbi:hypothetical protein OEIGOIKO_07380 [Streptomyces chrestomyceticus JCM 4735]|uniref:Uncharacterized protein n=1 Tax=Streptomyces chrestomyceticus JCM 4735 TaxID=1306181 RepID=A0A7U9L1X3_9ACTN|nr:hypothetical protein OEIGOIKO_07380 [Streptomyces chrestomyceticus JCM 4735]
MARAARSIAGLRWGGVGRARETYGAAARVCYPTMPRTRWGQPHSIAGPMGQIFTHRKNRAKGFISYASRRVLPAPGGKGSRIRHRGTNAVFRGECAPASGVRRRRPTCTDRVARAPEAHDVPIYAVRRERGPAPAGKQRSWYGPARGDLPSNSRAQRFVRRGDMRGFRPAVTWPGREVTAYGGGNRAGPRSGLVASAGNRRSRAARKAQNSADFRAFPGRRTGLSTGRSAIRRKFWLNNEYPLPVVFFAALLQDREEHNGELAARCWGAVPPDSPSRDGVTTSACGR